MTTAATYMTPQPKWRRVDFTSGGNRPSGGGENIPINGAFSFASRSYRQASVVFSSSVDRIVIKFRNLSCPVEIAVSGLGVSISDLRDFKSPHVITLDKRRTGTLSMGSAGFSPGAFWFDEIYGEVLA